MQNSAASSENRDTNSCLIGTDHKAFGQLTAVWVNKAPEYKNTAYLRPSQITVCWSALQTASSEQRCESRSIFNMWSTRIWAPIALFVLTIAFGLKQNKALQPTRSPAQPALQKVLSDSSPIFGDYVRSILLLC